MYNYKKLIAGMVSKASLLSEEELIDYIEVPENTDFGDFAFPCFKLAKSLKKSPTVIATELKEKIELDLDKIEKIDIVGGYLNFFINKKTLVKIVLEEIANKKEDYGRLSIGEGKTIVIDYSSPNIAKPFHIGHLRSTVIGGALYNIYKFLGYNTVGINHLGDYGTQFGKLIEGYKLWGNEYNIEENPIDELTKIYIRINNLCKEDENVLEACRNNFKKLEDGDSYCVELWNRFRNLSLKEFQKVYDLLGSKFDSFNGEAFYSDKMDKIVKKLEESGKLIESEGAKVVEVEGQAPCLITKSNGSTTYATRDLAAIDYRAKTYNYERNIYVTSYEQNLHFKQVFEVAKLLGLDEKYIKGLMHVNFGMVHLKTGKMSTRDGNIIKLEDLLNESIDRALKIVEEKNPGLEGKEDIAKKVGVGAVIFNDLSNSRIKDEVFDWNQILNFNGETGPYIQYIYVRTKSVIEKAGYIPDIANVDFSKLLEPEAVSCINVLYKFSDVLLQAAEKNEPFILSRYLIELSQSYNGFYNAHHIITEDKSLQDARLYLNYACKTVIKKGAELLGIQMPERM